MEMLQQKRDLIELCKKTLQDRANNAKTAMDELQQSANEYGIPRDKYDSFRAQAMRKKDLFAEQYQRALDDLQLLEKIEKDQVSRVVEFGSVVITDKQKMIISVSLGKVILGKDTYFAISPQVPLFNEMRGLKKGGSFKFNDSQFQILDIF